MSKKIFVLACAAVLALALPAAQAADYPSKPVRIVVGSPPGALGDVLSRVTGQKLGDALGQPFVVDNKPGAALAIAADLVAKSPGDGYTLLLAPDAATVVNPFVYPKLPYDPTKDFQSVALLGKATVVLVVAPSLGVKSLNDFVALAKARPAAINFGTGGSGHPTHILMELFANRLGLQMTHVPYKGSSPAIQAVVTGEVGSMIVGVAEAMPLIKAGRILPLAASGPQSKEVFPDLPELKSLNKDLDVSVWFAVFAPASTPKDVVGVLNGEINKALQSADMQKRLGEFGLLAQPGPPSELDALMRVDRARYGPLIKSLGITAE